jgi:hypothetical protein
MSNRRCGKTKRPQSFTGRPERESEAGSVAIISPSCNIAHDDLMTNSPRRRTRLCGRILTSIKVSRRGFGDPALVSGGDTTMTTETAILVGAITAAFIGFALTLWWAERQTRGLHRD